MRKDGSSSACFPFSYDSCRPLLLTANDRYRQNRLTALFNPVARVATVHTAAAISSQR
jgi:hypothetical protein